MDYTRFEFVAESMDELLENARSLMRAFLKVPDTELDLIEFEKKVIEIELMQRKRSGLTQEEWNRLDAQVLRDVGKYYTKENVDVRLYVPEDFVDEEKFTSRVQEVLEILPSAESEIECEGPSELCFGRMRRFGDEEFKTEFMSLPVGDHSQIRYSHISTSLQVRIFSEHMAQNAWTSGALLGLEEAIRAACKSVIYVESSYGGVTLSVERNFHLDEGCLDSDKVVEESINRIRTAREMSVHYSPDRRQGHFTPVSLKRVFSKIQIDAVAPRGDLRSFLDNYFQIRSMLQGREADFERFIPSAFDLSRVIPSLGFIPVIVSPVYTTLSFVLLSFVGKDSLLTRVYTQILSLMAEELLFERFRSPVAVGEKTALTYSPRSGVETDGKRILFTIGIHTDAHPDQAVEALMNFMASLLSSLSRSPPINDLLFRAEQTRMPDTDVSKLFHSDASIYKSFEERAQADKIRRSLSPADVVSFVTGAFRLDSPIIEVYQGLVSLLRRDQVSMDNKT